MQITTRQTPAFGIARLALAPSESVRAEAGAMMAMSTGTVLWQTRNPNELIGWIQSFVGTANSGSSGVGGALGGLFGRD